nr:hypothetical protein [Crateriforma spongiae]
METVFAKAHRTELGSAPQVTIASAGDMGVDDGAIGGDRDLQIGEVTRSVEELPVLVGLQGFIPTERSDRFLASEECVADHVAPGNSANTLLFAAVHPDAFAVHQRRKHRGSTASTLSDGENVEFVRREVLANAVDVKIRRNDVIVVEQKDVLGLRSIDRRIASDSDAHIVPIQVDDRAMLGGFGILRTEAKLWATIVDDDDRWVDDMIAQRLDQPMARPRPVNRLDAERDVCR